MLKKVTDKVGYKSEKRKQEELKHAQIEREKKEHEELERKRQEQAAREQERHFEDWTCRRCGYLNPGKNNYCQKCGCIR